MRVLLFNFVLMGLWVVVIGVFIYSNSLFGFVIVFIMLWWLWLLLGYLVYFCKLLLGMWFMLLFLWELLKFNICVVWDVIIFSINWKLGIIVVLFDVEIDLEIMLFFNLIMLMFGSMMFDFLNDCKMFYVYEMFVDDLE